MKKIKILIGFVLLLGLASCTNDFKEINTNPNGVTQAEASARYFITNPQYRLYAPDRYPYWRAQLIHTDRYAGHFTFGFNGSWWGGSLGYSYSSGYTGAAWNWMEGYLGGLDNFMKLTDTGGEFENELMYATGLIMKGLYYQMFTDVFGEVPYSEAADPDVVLPKFDAQKDIYQGIIADLDRAIAIIGDATTSGDGVQDLGDNDLYCHGDMQKWKRLASSLKLRIAIRAYGASGDTFAAATVTSALAGDLLETESDNVVLDKDAEISQWGAACYGDVWHNFGGLGSKWHVGEQLINYLQDYGDPRLDLYAQPALGGTFGFKQPESTVEDTEPHDYFFERVQHIRDKIAHVVGNTDFYEELPDSVTFTLPENTYYIGQPTRQASGVYNYTRWEFFSQPSEVVTQQKNQGQKPFNELILTSGETYLLRAQAAVLGLSGENAQSMYEDGIRYSMRLWGVGDDDIDNFIATSAMGQLDGTQEQNLEKIAIQRWLAMYTDGFEAWSIVRKTGYPSELANGVTNEKLYYIGGDIGDMYPQRLRYGGDTYAKNGTNTSAAVSRQGPDLQTTELWYAK
ncbi:MAG: SusD/RagB family nutrient-binding outer membrane lipoprotein [Bacteroidetes bacterium]|nr:MAG: SusD/RagB family nutrient-binding outer membrane lipoprotein [Bacteroidota bacterium]